MAGEGNILITDESALHALLHADWAGLIEPSIAKVNPLTACATTLEGLRAFNVHHPLYGPPPISLLVQEVGGRRFCSDVICRFTSAPIPPDSFFALREGLYLSTPEFTYLRMARGAADARLAEIAMSLCARYYIDPNTSAICERKGFLTTPGRLRRFASLAHDVGGAKKAMSALRWVLPNSGSPYETKMKLLFCHPPSRGGFGLPFTAMNYDVSAGRLQRIMGQSVYCIDMADVQRHVGMEFDGEEYHRDSGKDKRRRNELEAMGWAIFPIDKHVLHDPEACIRVAEQVAKRMRIRLRRPSTWESKHIRLRAELGLNRKDSSPGR